jgi:PAS domain S-box-containing protein
VLDRERLRKATIRDAKEQQRLQTILELSEEKYKKAFYLTPDAMNINRLEDGMYVSVNEGFTRILGYTPEDVLGKTSLSLNIWANPLDRKKLLEG